MTLVVNVLRTAASQHSRNNDAAVTNTLLERGDNWIEVSTKKSKGIVWLNDQNTGLSIPACAHVGSNEDNQSAASSKACAAHTETTSSWLSTSPPQSQYQLKQARTSNSYNQYDIKHERMQHRVKGQKQVTCILLKVMANTQDCLPQDASDSAHICF